MLPLAPTRRAFLGMMGGSALALGGCATRQPGLSPGASPQDLLDSLAWNLLHAEPEQATSLGVDTGVHSDLRRELKDRSPEGIESLARMVRADLARVESIKASGLDPSMRTSLAVVRSAYRAALDGFDLPYGDVAVGGWRNTPYVVIQNVGAYLDTPRFLDADHPVRNAEDAQAYLDRLAQFPKQLDGELERIRAAASLGLVAPDFILARTAGQLRQSIAATWSGGGIVQSLMRRTASIPGDWEARALRIATSQIAPALQRQLEEIERQIRSANDHPGLSERPHGAEFYAWALRASTTTRHTPNEVHEQGLEELASLHARMNPILRKLGYTDGSVGQRMTAISGDPRFKFGEGDDGRARIMATIHRQIEWIRAQMPRAFLRPAQGRVEVRRLPLAEEPGAPNAYGGAGSIDGSIPGKMWINLRTTDLHRRYDLPTLVHHEAIPGHVWQGEYANQLPLIRSVLGFNAYSEGWALYAEQLADELGAYDDDPVGRLGYLQSLAFRACRMVVDTGLHAKGWSREQAVDFFVTRNGNKREEVVSEVDRYCSWPGQACGYKMGHSEILRQRQLAKDALGAAYDLRALDQAVVDGGNVPLDVLADTVARYVANAGG